MSRKRTNPWIKSEQKRGFKASRLSILFGLMGILCGVIQAGAIARLLACLLNIEKGVVSAWAAGLVFCLAVLCRAAIQIRLERGNFELGAAARRRLRNHVLRALLGAGPAGVRGRHSAELASIVVDRVEVMEGLHARWIPASGLAIIGPAFIATVALLVDWRSGVYLIIAGLFVPFSMAVAGIGAGIAAKKQFLAMTRLQVRFLDRIRGISTIVLFGRSEDEAQALGFAATELRQRTMRVLRMAFLSSTALDLSAAAVLILIVVRFMPVLHGANELAPTALFLILLVPEFFAPLRGFAAVYGDRMAVEAVADDFSKLPEIPKNQSEADIGSVFVSSVSLAFEHVTYGWDERSRVLENLSFKVESGEMLLLTGTSGAGKSTVIDLILGFLTPQSGSIKINGADIDTLVPAARARIIGWVGQKPVVFSGTIEDNIRFAKPSASGDEVKAAVHKAHLETMINNLPQGLQTPLGEGGYGVSGGQAQRIAIARAFLKDAPLLLLDEPTSHLDPAVEADILESLKQLAVGRTVILASHSMQAIDFSKTIGAKRVDLQALRYASWRGVGA